MYRTAAGVINDHLDAHGGALSGAAAERVREAVGLLETVLAERPDSWQTLWLHGKGQTLLGHHEEAHASLVRAHELEQGVEAIPRELAGVCLELRRFDEAVAISERAVALVPDNAELLGNLALAYLMAGRIEAAEKTIAAAVEIDGDDEINATLLGLIEEVSSGRRPQPRSLAALTAPAKPRKRFWELWKLWK